MDPANLPQMPWLASTLLHLSATMIWGVWSWNGSENWFPTKIQPVKDRYATFQPWLSRGFWNSPPDRLCGQCKWPAMSWNQQIHLEIGIKNNHIEYIYIIFYMIIEYTHHLIQYIYISLCIYIYYVYIYYVYIYIMCIYISNIESHFRIGSDISIYPTILRGATFGTFRDLSPAAPSKASLRYTPASARSCRDFSHVTSFIVL
jgi:hypothetical protein